MSLTEHCAGCDARDMHIQSLKEEIARQADLIDELNAMLAMNERRKDDVISHLTGMNRVAAGKPQGEMHSVPRTNTIRDRIAKAEKAEMAEPSMKAAREREYQDRLNKLINPEIEVRNDAV